MIIPSIPTKYLQKLQKDFEEAYPPYISTSSLELCLQLKQSEHRYSVYVESKQLLEFDVSQLKYFFETFSIDFDITTIEYIKSSERCVVRSYVSFREALIIQSKLTSFSLHTTIELTENE